VPSSERGEAAPRFRLAAEVRHRVWDDGEAGVLYCGLTRCTHLIDGAAAIVVQVLAAEPAPVDAEAVLARLGFDSDSEAGALRSVNDSLKSLARLQAVTVVDG
jgi:hypothetical protein